ncbi:MAG: hypothetical protein ACRDCT_13235 [Shewanella sp.]
MTINLSEERHESDCRYLAGEKQQTGNCHSGAVAWFLQVGAACSKAQLASIIAPTYDF